MKKDDAVKVKVITRFLDTNETETRVIDHSKSEQRQWLGKHAFWAVRNRVEIITRPVDGGSNET